MEDLKEIEYEGGKTTHGDVRRAINENVASANRNFSEVSEAATEAQSGVTELREQLDEVSATATEAKNGVTELGQKVEGVSSVATEAQSGVTELRQQLGEVSDTATKAQTGVTELGEQLEGVSAVAQEALGAANSAQHTAATANSTAATAKSDAPTAKSTAEAAKSTAEAAKSTAETANSTAGAAKTAAEGAAADAATAKSDAATAKNDAATAKSTAEAAKSTAETASQTAATAKSTADTAKQTAEEAKASAEGLTGEVTGLGQQLDEVAADATGATDGLHQFMTLGILTEAPFPRATAEASGSFAAVGGDAPLKDGEIIPWTGWLTLVLCYQTTDSAAKVKLTGYAGPTLGKCELIPETAVAATEEPRVVRITGEHDYNPRRIGSPDACMAGSSYHVNVEVKSQNAGFTMLWAVVYESDEYGNPRRRGGSLREQIEGTLQSCPALALGTSTTTATVYNEKTGWFEVNGLVDMTFDDCLLVLKDFPAKTAINSLNNDFISHARTNNALQGIYNSDINFNFYNDGGETLALGPQLRSSMSGFLYNNNNNNNNNILAILSYIRLQSASISAGSSLNCENLESLAIMNISGSYSFARNPSLSWDSWKYLIDNAAEGISEEGITVTVHADVYAKMSGGTVDDWGSLGTLASEKGVKLVSFGESGYPFLTRVLWHGYKRLKNKINAATNGDTIYIHPDDRRKISAAQKDNWGTLVTLAAEKNIIFAQAE